MAVEQHMDHTQFVLKFHDATVAEANRYAADLASVLRTIHPGVLVSQQRDRIDTQDLGSTIALILGTGSATVVAHGIAAWLSRHTGATVEISANGAVIASNLDSRDAARIAEAFSRKK
jgi:hypothetical protein